MSKLSIAVDLMGGDHAPESVAVPLMECASLFSDIVFHVAGTEDALERYIQNAPSNIIKHVVSEVVGMSDRITSAMKLLDRSSMGYCIKLVKDQTCGAVLSAGNTAALMSLGCLLLRTKTGVRRPAILSHIQYQGTLTMFADLGANISCNADDMVTNAYLAVEELGLEKARVALLNVGKEEAKGTAVVKEAAKKLQESELNYVGFVEGDDLLSGMADVIVFDGFTGNCLTKLLESMVASFSEHIPMSNLPCFASAALMAGLNGKIYKIHGKSSKVEIRKGIQQVVENLRHERVTVLEDM